jgi:hypothetical protein
MNGVLQDGVSKSHGNPARIVGTTQKEALMNNLVMYPSPGETLGFSTVLTNQHVGTELQGLKPHSVLVTSERASSAMVGTIMALLATFDEAGVLPPEGTTQANQVIHGLIQLQSALMKSPSSELAAYRKAAVAHWTGQHKEREVGTFREKGLTDRILAALIAYDLDHPLWEDPKIVSALQAFNVTSEGRSIHIVYENWRMNMPGGKS